MTSLPPDPYKTLGVSKDAQITEIRSAHRKLVLKCHPDKVQDETLKALAQDEFQKVQRAYEILSDEKERQRYDDQARLAELRKQMQSKANTSSPRATPTTYKYEVRTAEPRPSSYKSTPGTSPSTKSFYPRSYEETRGPQIFDAEPRVRREASYSDKPSKREVEREREKKEERERSKKLAENLRRMEKEAKEQKEARRAEKKKEREKERKREATEKKSHSKPYIESYDDEVLVKEKKKSSKKHDEKRDRSSHREEAMPRMNAVHDPMPEEPYEDKVSETFDQALSYIQAKNRSKAYHPTRVQPPAAPTPPPAPGQSSPFAPPEDDARRSSARVRRGSSGEKKAHKKPSNEVLDDPIIVNTSPSARYAGRSATTATAAGLSGSPPRRELHRQYSSPAAPDLSSRVMPTMSRSQTFTAGLYPEMADPRGRGRSKQHPQIQEESDSEEDRAQRHRERKHRSSKKYRSPSRPAQQVHQYKVDSKGHATLHTTYSRSMEPMVDSYAYYPSTTHGIQVQETRPSMSTREASYSSSPGNYMPFHKVKTSRAYDYGDVAFSNSYPQHDEYAEAY